MSHFGKIYDKETGLYYLRARYYDPQVGRFINEDTEEGTVTDPLSLNWYNYCDNDPIDNIDPSGHSKKDIFDMLADKIVGLATGEKSGKKSQQQQAIGSQLVCMNIDTLNGCQDLSDELYSTFRAAGSADRINEVFQCYLVIPDDSKAPKGSATKYHVTTAERIKSMMDI